MAKFKVGTEAIYNHRTGNQKYPNELVVITEVRGCLDGVRMYGVEHNDGACGHVFEDELSHLPPGTEEAYSNLSLFASGWADFHGNHRDYGLWSNSFYRGGWMAAASEIA